MARITVAARMHCGGLLPDSTFIAALDSENGVGKTRVQFRYP